MTVRAPEALTERHDLDTFDSGNAALDDWLKRRALANQTSGASRTFVACDGVTVIAYYALASGSVTHRDAVSSFRRNMPDPVPVVILARLAVDLAHQKAGFGRGLIKDAAKRVAAAADQIGVRGLIVHAINEDAKAYYLKRGFRPSPTNDMTLMIPLGDLRAAL